jgi:heme-degrading monooxygenase HmoA
LEVTAAPSGRCPDQRSFVVFARTTTVQADTSKIDDGIANVRDEVTPAITAMDGCVGMSMLVDRESGRCIATSSWESEAAMQDSATRVLPLRDGAERALGASSSTVDTWEVAVVHRDHAMPDGACARVTWLSAMADHAERAADVFRMAVLPRIQELDGFCSASLLINRDAGRAVATVTFERRDQLEASRDAATAIREAASRDIGATIDDVAEMEVAFAHLHLPEMA